LLPLCGTLRELESDSPAIVSFGRKVPYQELFKVWKRWNWRPSC
jgi:hypothetical protein